MKVLVDAKTLSIAAMRVGSPDRRPSQSIAAMQPMSVFNREP
jgi:hypothetical protein